MGNVTQVFQTNSRWRWQTFKWLGRITIFLVILMVPAIALTIFIGIQPVLPLLTNQINPAHHVSKPTVPIALNAKQLKKYKGYINYLSSTLTTARSADSGKPIRAAFYVDWDPQSFYSLQKNIDKLNLVVPEWFFIDPKTDSLLPRIDMTALELMKKNHVRIVPLINNINENKGEGEFTEC